MTVQAEVAKDENGLPQKQIVSMTIESEPMREQPVITAVPEQSQDAEPPAPDTAEAVAETVPESKQQQVAEAAVVTETAADQDELLAEMAADTADTAPAPTTTAATSAQFDAQALLAMLPDTVAIQLGVFSQEAAAKKFLQQYSTLNLQLYQRQQQGKTQFVVVSASYVNGAAARQQVKSLPEELRQQTPFVKALSDIQREIQSSNAR
jgi:septal ring-binding cell division protein DamX